MAAGDVTSVCALKDSCVTPAHVTSLWLGHSSGHSHPEGKPGGDGSLCMQGIHVVDRDGQETGRIHNMKGVFSGTMFLLICKIKPGAKFPRRGYKQEHNTDFHIRA